MAKAERCGSPGAGRKKTGLKNCGALLLVSGLTVCLNPIEPKTALLVVSGAASKKLEGEERPPKWRREGQLGTRRKNRTQGAEWRKGDRKRF